METWGQLILGIFGRSKKFLSLNDICNELNETSFALGKMDKKIINKVLNENSSDSSLWRGKRDYFKSIKIDNEIYWAKRRDMDYKIRDPFEQISLNTKNHEGSIKRYFHKLRERNKFIVKEKIESVINLSGKLNCEICNFNFEDFYGNRGHNFIECHHKVPLSKLKPHTVTEINDLAIVCSNCHRMLHKKPYPSIKSLKKQLSCQ